MNIQDLIKKYEKEIQELNLEASEDQEDEELQMACYSSITHIEGFIKDLKEYERFLNNQLVELNQIPIEFARNENPYPPLVYPPLRERLICSVATGLIAANPIDLHGNCALPVGVEYAKNVTSYADEIIKQMNEK